MQGDAGALALFATANLAMCATMMPCGRFSYGVECVEGKPVFLPRTKRYGGVYAYDVARATARLGTVIALSVRLEILTTSPLEFTKMK